MEQILRDICTAVASDEEQLGLLYAAAKMLPTEPTAVSCTEHTRPAMAIPMLLAAMHCPTADSLTLHAGCDALRLLGAAANQESGVQLQINRAATLALELQQAQLQPPDLQGGLRAVLRAIRCSHDHVVLHALHSCIYHLFYVADWTLALVYLLYPAMKCCPHTLGRY